MQLAKHKLGEIILENNITKKDLVYSSNCVLRKPHPISMREVSSKNCTVINNAW